jgi:dihydrofolate synthase/folylpolyglutamate synthase
VASLADWLARQERSHPSAIDLGLERVRSVARRLGLLAPATAPERKTITVGGTNGKGSTVAFLDAFLREAGHRCGRFTSPHLSRYNERICIDGREASDADLVASFERIEAARGDTSLTFFEYNALAALDLFRRAAVDVAVLEVGLGGRLDATNIVDADVAVVCSIGLDHVEWLGHTLEDIGREKAGIFRHGRPAVLGSAEMPASVFEVIENVGAHAVVPGRDYHVTRQGTRWTFTCGAFRFEDLPPPALSGAQQIGNAAAALAALVAGGLTAGLTGGVVSRALRSAQVRGRFQLFQQGDVHWVLDVAHNAPAARALRENLAALPPLRTLAVCGVLGDKDIAGVLREVAPAIDGWVLTALEGPRSVPTRELESRLPAGAPVLAHATDVAAACRAARDEARPGDRIVVFGSFLCVGPALEFLGI